MMRLKRKISIARFNRKQKKPETPYSRRRFKQNKKKVRPNVHFRSIARFNRKTTQIGVPVSLFYVVMHHGRIGLALAHAHVSGEAAGWHVGQVHLLGNGVVAALQHTGIGQQAAQPLQRLVHLEHYIVNGKKMVKGKSAQ